MPKFFAYTDINGGRAFLGLDHVVSAGNDQNSPLHFRVQLVNQTSVLVTEKSEIMNLRKLLETD